MSFSTATITSGPVASADGALTFVEWTSSSPVGTLFQLYINRHLTWHGTDTFTYVPIPSGLTYFQVGTVGPGEGNTDFSADLAAIPGNGNCATVTWQGGTFEELAPPGSGMAGFHVYMSPTAGAFVNYSNILDDIPLSDVAGNVIGGYGIGGYGSGPYGSDPGGLYSWTSDPLTNGSWTIGIKAYDNAGNESATREVIVTISGPPAPPAPDPTTGDLLTYTYAKSTRIATLHWNASPG